jgi:hypothetical protein
LSQDALWKLIPSSWAAKKAAEDRKHQADWAAACERIKVMVFRDADAESKAEATRALAAKDAADAYAAALLHYEFASRALAVAHAKLLATSTDKVSA